MPGAGLGREGEGGAVWAGPRWCVSVPPHATAQHGSVPNFRFSRAVWKIQTISLEYSFKIQLQKELMGTWEQEIGYIFA